MERAAPRQCKPPRLLDSILAVGDDDLAVRAGFHGLADGFLLSVAIADTVIDFVADISTTGFEPGEPFVTTVTPDARPCMASSARTGLNFSMSAPRTVDIAPDTLVIFCVP